MAAAKLDVKCPAGRLVAETEEGPTVECRVEKSLIGAATNPRTLSAFCLNCYTDCPTWRAEKERQWARQRELVPGETPVR